MARGIERREGVADSLAGSAEVVPVVSNAAPLAAPNLQVHSQNYTGAAAMYGVERATQVSNSLNKWASSKFQEVASKRQEASILDGQMAYQQGKTMDEVEMEGDKWSLSGYRVMHAQTLSQSMLAAQRTMIQQAQYEQDPDAFRAQYVKRMEAQIDGLDPQTARMVREQMSEHMPTLVAQHTSAHLGYQEREAYKALVTSVDPMSQDPSAFDALLTNAAGGEGSPSAGLSKDRRIQAVVDGVSASFENMNPVAYQQLKQSGLLDEMSTAQKEGMRNAQKKYENRVRTTYDGEHQEAMTTFQRNLDAGKYSSPEEAADDLATIYARRNITMSAAEGGAAYNGAVAAQDHGDRAHVVNIQTAQARGDYDTLAKLTQDIVMHHESRGRADAVGPMITSGANAGTQAQGAMQVMPLTMKDPGFGIRPSNGTQADTLRVGREYWAMLVKRYDGNIEAAAIGYNAGPGNGDVWVRNGGGEAGWSALAKKGVKVSETRPYAENIASDAAGGNLHYSSSERLSMAQAELRTAQSIRAEMLKEQEDALNQEAEVEYANTMAVLDDELKTGAITPDQYRQWAGEANEDLGITQTVVHANHINSQISSAVDAARDAIAEKAEDAETFAEGERLEYANIQVAALKETLTTALATPGITREEVGELTTQFVNEAQQVYADEGFGLKESNMASTVREAMTAQRQADAKIRQRQEDDVVIAHAVDTGTVSSLPKALRDRYEREFEARLEKDIADAAARGEIDDGKIVETIQGEAEVEALKAGTVTKAVQAQSTLNMRKIVDPKTGDPDPRAVDTLMRFGRLRSEDPATARTMFATEEAFNTAVSVLEAAQGDLSNPQQVGDAIVAAHTEREYNFGLSAVQDQTMTDKINKDLEKGIDKFLAGEELGIVQTLISSEMQVSDSWKQTNVEQDLVGAESTRENLVNPIRAEAYRLLKEDPALSPKIAVQIASANVLDRTAIIGGTAHVMKPGQSIKKEMFGTAASTYARPGIENEVVVNYLANLAESDPDLAWMAETTTGESTPGAGAVLSAGDFAAGLIDQIPLIGELTDGEVTQRAMKPMDAIAVSKRGVRPFIFQSDGEGETAARILLPDGTYSPPIPVPLGEAGKMWIKQHHKKLTD